MNRMPLVVLGTLLAPLRLAAQDRAVTLADAIKLAERTQPSVVQAQGQVETAAAQRRSAWGAFLPSLTAGSSASDFYSEGASRIDPVTGQVLSGNTTNRSVNASLRASVKPSCAPSGENSRSRTTPSGRGTVTRRSS